MVLEEPVNSTTGPVPTATSIMENTERELIERGESYALSMVEMRMAYLTGPGAFREARREYFDHVRGLARDRRAEIKAASHRRLAARTGAATSGERVENPDR